MSSRSEQSTSLDAGPLGPGDLLLIAQWILTWKQRAKWACVGIAALVLTCASLLIGHELGILLFSMLQK